MWQEWCLYVSGAILGVIEVVINHPWKPLEGNLAFSSSLSVISLGASVLGGAAGISKINEGAGGQGMWVAIIAFAILFLVNFVIFAHKMVIGYRHFMTQWAMKEKKCSLCSCEDCIDFGDINGLREALKRKYPGIIKVSNALLRDVMKLRLLTLDSIKAYLRKLRGKSPLNRYSTYRFLKRELQAVFLTTLCLESLKTARPEVVKHLRSLTIALYRRKGFRKFKFKEMLEGWRLPSDSGAQELEFADLNYETMERVDFSKNVYKCGLCESFWEKSWKDLGFITKTTTCRCCEMFSLSIKDGLYNSELRASPTPAANSTPTPAPKARCFGLFDVFKRGSSSTGIGTLQASTGANVDPSEAIELDDLPEESGPSSAGVIPNTPPGPIGPSQDPLQIV